MSRLKAALRALRRGDKSLAERELALDLEGEVAEAWLLRGILRHSVEDLRHGMKKGPTDTTLVAQATEIFLEKGRTLDARAALRCLDGLVTPAERARVKRRLANLELDLGSYQQGIAEYRAALALAPDSVQIAHELCQHLRELGDFEAALEILKRISNSTPSLMRTEAELLVKLGRHDEARALARTIGDVDLLIFAGAFSDAKRLLEAKLRDQADVSVRLTLAELASWSGELQTARDLVAQALEVEPDSQRALRIRATLHLLSGELELAERDLTRVLARDPDDALALIWRGEAQRRRGRWEAAWDDLGRGIERTRGYPIGAHATLVATHAGRDFEGALDPDLYRELCVILTPLFAILGEDTGAPRSNQDVFRRMEAVLSAMLGNRGPRPSFVHEGTLLPLDLPLHARFQARAVQELLRTRPPSFVIQSLQALAAERPTEATVHCHLGEVHLWLGDWASAEHAFLAAVEIARDTRWAYVGLCATELGKNQPERAIEWCARGEEEALPGRTQYAYRGEAYRRLGDRTRALLDLQRSLELTPTRVSAWLNLALVDRAPLVLDSTFRALLEHAPGLVHDACTELELESERLMGSSGAIARVFEHCLGMMRGNRASSLVTYFTRSGELRFVPPPGPRR